MAQYSLVIGKHDDETLRKTMRNRLTGFLAIIVSLIVTVSMCGCSSISSFDNAINGITASDKSSASSGSGNYSATEWNMEDAPNYYRVDGKAIQSYDIAQDGSAHYGDLDSLGRATWGAIWITPDVWKREASEGRESDRLPDPVGYKGNNSQVSVALFNGSTYHGWFYNRSHLVADSLGGDPVKENLVTGTRMQNVGTNNAGSSGYGGMAYAEDMVRDYMYDHPVATVYYSATPVYKGNELLPRSVFVDVKSDDGELDEHIEVYNVQNGYSIDYGTGRFAKE